MRSRSARSAGSRSPIQIHGHTARHDAVAHHAMTETAVGGAQHALAQHAAMGQHQRKSGIVADGADIAQMIGQPLQFRHQRPQILRPRRRLDTERGFGSAGKGKGIGHRAVAGDPAGDLRGAFEVAPRISDSTPLCV